MAIGVLTPIGSKDWLISATSPQRTPSFDLNRKVVQRAERYGVGFALSVIKLRGFGGPSRHPDDTLESFTLMAALAAVTSRIEPTARHPSAPTPPSPGCSMRCRRYRGSRASCRPSTTSSSAWSSSASASGR